MTESRGWGGLIAHYRERLPVRPGDRVITLNEGNTPLVRADRLAAAVAPGIEMYLKIDGLATVRGAPVAIRIEEQLG